MDPHTREAVGRLTHWLVLAGAVVLGVVALSVQVGALAHSVAASRDWSVTPDALSSTKGVLILQIHTGAPLRAIGRGFYWYGPDGQLHDPGFGNDVTYYRLPEGAAPGIFPVRNVVNPYARYAPGAGGSAAHLYLRRTQLAVLDVRSILAGTEDGRLAADAGRQWAQRPLRVRLVQLAQARPLVYLAPFPLIDYDRARAILRQAPVGAVVTAGHRYRSAPTDDQIVDRLTAIRRHVGIEPILLTEDADLAAHVRSEKLPVVLVGSGVADPPPPLGSNVRDWASAADYLAGGSADRPMSMQESR